MHLSFKSLALGQFKLSAKFMVTVMLLSISFIGASLAQSIVPVLSVDEGQINRLTFYINNETSYEAEQQENQFVISFNQSIDFDFAALSINPLPYVSEPSYSFVADGSVVTLTLSDNAEVNHFRENSRLVIEVSVPQPAEPVETIVAEDVADDEIIEQEAEAEPIVDEDDVVAAQLRDVAQFGNEEAAQLAAAAAAAEQEQEQVNDVEQAVAPIRQIRPTNLDPGEVLNITMENGQDEQVLIFTWRFPVGAAVFSRGGFLWVIFDEESNADLVAVQPFLNDRILSAEQASDIDQTLFRFQLKPDQGMVTQRQDNSWIVRISDVQVAPVIPISLARQENIGDNFRIFVPLDNPGPHLRILDPVVGDVIDVIPVFDGGMGTSRERNFAQFKILPSAQGLVLNRTSDQVVVSRFSNGVAIGGITNLAVSLSPLATDLGLRSDSGDENLRPAKLIDFEVWRLGGLEDFNANKTKLFGELSTAADEDLNDKRWDAARFYLGHGMAVEALAFLDLMAEKDAEIMVDPKYRAVRGVTLFYLRKYDEAWRQLSARELDAETSIYLWRSIVAQKQGKDERALELFERGRESLQYYEVGKSNLFRIGVVEAALNVDQFDTANWQLSLLRRTEMEPYQKAEVDYLEGHLLEKMGEYEEAMNYFREVSEFVNRRASAYSRYSMTISRFERGEITPDEAILEMERLRYSWRGDMFEQRLLHGLGKLYLEKKNYRMGLFTLRQAVATFDESNETSEMTVEMVEAYRDLFLNGTAEEMPPVQALALYYDFRELTPLGSEGDQMIRRLADRLVSVDLLGRAAELLDHQVRFRLNGAAQSIIANRLAKVYLLDHKPEMALEILRLTRQNTLPADVLQGRNLVEARALTELHSFEEAEVLIQNIDTVEAQELRADIYWGSDNWEKVASAIGQLLDNRWMSEEPLSDDERQYLIRQVIALSLLDRRDELELAKVRYEALMQDGLLANAFNVITNPEGGTTEELRDVVRRTASVSTLKSFMNSYRSEFTQGS